MSVEKIMLTQEQYEQYDLLSIEWFPNLKHADKAYVRRWLAEVGPIKVELDALSVRQIQDILRDRLSEYVDTDQDIEALSRAEVERWKRGD